MTDYLCLLLPFPPSTNNLFPGREKRFMSKAYRRWSKEAKVAVADQPHAEFAGAVKLTLALGRPNKTRRDVSNYIKAPEDFMVKHGVLADDSQVIEVRAYWADDVVNGCRIEVEAA